MTRPYRTELIITNLGTPEEATPEGVRAFLDEFLSDPMVVEYPRWFWIPLLRGIILRTRPKRVAEAYQTIWTEAGSPLRVKTEEVAATVHAQAPDDVAASSAYRYGHPNIEERLTRAFERADRVVFTTMFPQRTASSSGTAEKEARRVAEKLGCTDRLEVRPLSFTDEDYIAAVADRVRTELAQYPGEKPHLMGSFHSIPDAVNRREGERYTGDCRATFEALLAELDWDPNNASLAFQSVFGPTKWVGPATADRLEASPGEGITRLLMVMPGFLTGGLETLEEIAVEGRETFLQAGGQEFRCVPAVAEHAMMVKAFLRKATAAEVQDRVETH